MYSNLADVVGYVHQVPKSSSSTTDPEQPETSCSLLLLELSSSNVKYISYLVFAQPQAAGSSPTATAKGDLENQHFPC